MYKDGFRRLASGDEVQRWLCRNCGYRFSETSWNNSEDSQNVQKIQRQILNCADALPYNRQVSVTQSKEAKNLAEVESRNEKQAAGATVQAADIKGKIIEFLWHLKKQGLAEISIKGYRDRLLQMVKNKVNLLDPEAVKEFLAKQSSWSNRTKMIDTTIYDHFLKVLKISWDPPIYKPERKLPFIPTEQEIDQLIAAAGKKLATFLQVLKETGARCGEAARLEWTDIDFERKTTHITPEKGSNPRILPISAKLTIMLQNLPKKSERVFPATLNAIKSNFFLQRRTIARKMGNPRLLKIHLHTFRHFKGTTEYHKTKDIIHVQQILGHQDIKSTMMYIQIEQALFQNSMDDEFHVKVAKTEEEIKGLLEIGYEFILQKDGLAYFRKRK